MRSLAVRSRPLFVGLLLVLSLHAHAAVREPEQPLDRIVAVVNNDVIVMSELQQRMRLVRAQLRQAGTPAPPASVLRRQVLEKMIMDRLQLQLAKSSGLSVDDDTLNRTIQNIAQKNGLTVRQFRDVLEQGGYDFSKFREDVRNQLLISQLQQRDVTSRITVTPREIENYLATKAQQGAAAKDYHLAHILIAVPEAASPEQIAAARKKADGVLQQLRNGADFAQTAVAVSDDPQALHGGDLGWRKGSELPTIFANIVPKMHPGEISGLIRSPSGFHIIKLLGVRGQARHVITQTHVRQILIRTNEVTSNADARTQLEQLRERIENGASFAELARAHSDDRASAINGGDLGWVNPGQVVPRFEKVMNSLQPDQISEPFRTQFGWHILEVLGRRQYDGTEEVKRSQAAEAIRRRKTEEALQSWLRQLRDEAYVELRLKDND